VGAQQREHGRNRGHRVGAVGVHLDDRVVALGDGRGKPGTIRGPEAVLGRAGEQREPVPEAVVSTHQGPGAIGAVVVDDQDVDRRVLNARSQRLEGRQQPGEGGGLVVGRNDDHATHSRTVGGAR